MSSQTGFNFINGQQNRDEILSGVCCAQLVSDYFEIPENVTGFRITICADYPAQLVFLKDVWDNQFTKMFKGVTVGEVDLEFQRKLASALGITNLGETYNIQVEVRSVDGLVTTTIKQYTTYGQLEDCLKLLKGESQ